MSIPPVKGLSAGESDKVVLSQPVVVESQDLLSRIKVVVDFTRDKVWAFLKESTKCAKSGLQIGLIAGGSALANDAAKIKTAIAGLGVVGLVNLFFTLFGVPYEIKEILDKNRIGDSEGVVRAAIGSFASGADALSDLAGVVTSISALGAVVAAPVLAFFTVIGLPLAIAGLGYATAKGVYDLVHNAISVHGLSKMLKVMNQQNVANKVDQLKEYINDQLGVTMDSENKLKFDDMHVSIIERRSDKRVVGLMKELRVYLDTQAEGSEDVAKLALEHMKGLMWRKIGINTIGVVGTAALCATLIASLIVPVMSPIAIPVVGGTKAFMGIVKSGLNIGLEKWHHNWYEQNSKRFTVASAA